MSEKKGILIIRSGSFGNLAIAIKDLRRRFPASRISVLADPDILGELSRRSDVDEVLVYYNLKSFLSRQLWRLRQQKYDFKVSLWTNEDEGRYNKFKVLAFLLRPRHMLVYNENGDSFALSIRDWRVVLNHILWRARASGVSLVGFDGFVRLARGILNVLLLPVAFLLLLLSTGWLLARRSYYSATLTGGRFEREGHI